jgi:hypothetical protein
MVVKGFGLKTLRSRRSPRRQLREAAPPGINHSSTAPHYVPGMDETQTLALQPLREPLGKGGRNEAVKAAM